MSWDMLLLFWPGMVASASAGLVLSVQGSYMYASRATVSWLTVAQACMAGVAIGWSFELSPLLSWLCGLGLGMAILKFAHGTYQPAKESVLLALMLGLQGLSVLLLDGHAHESHELSAALFGSAVLVAPAMAVGTGVLAVAVSGMYWYKGRQMLWLAVHPTAAIAAGGSRARVVLRGHQIAVVAVLAWVIQTIGLAPALGYAIAAPLVASALAPSFGVMIAVAAVSGITAAIGGFALSIVFDFPVGATQVTLIVALASFSLLKQNKLHG